MKPEMSRFPLSIRLLCLVGLLASPAAADWHHPLDLDGGGWWAGRLRVEVRNGRETELLGEPVAVPVGEGAGEAELAGKRAESIRVCNAEGIEMRHALYGPDGGLLDEGSIPAGGTLVIPAECAPGGEATYFVYFDNPAAWVLPDALTTRPGLVNGDLEHGREGTPEGWQHDTMTAEHRLAWVREDAQSGQWCLKTEVDRGAEPSWIATRQRDIHVVAGARYRMTGWVRGEGVEGFAGWYIHLGHERNSMLDSRMLTAGEGTFDWRRVEAEFTVPEGANRATVGTVLRGTGTAWFDNVSLECLEAPGTVEIDVFPPETMPLAELGAEADWFDDAAESGVRRDQRAVVRAMNFSSQPVAGGLLAFDFRLLENRMRGRLDPASMVVTAAGQPLPHAVYGETLLVTHDLAPRTAQTFSVYLGEESPAVEAAEVEAELPLAERNRLTNPDFEEGEDVPAGWTDSGPPGTAGEVTYGFDTPGKRGDRCAMLHVPAGARAAWRGWRQTVEVEPGRTYLVAAWVKCRNVDEHGVVLHAHLRTAEGEFSQHGGFASVGEPLRGTADWTLMAGLLTMPDDASQLDLHLTMEGTGTLWHDAAVVAEVLPGRLARFEGRPMEPEALAVWQVPAVEKVFPDTPAPREAGPARIAAARNEAEPVQLALRSGRAIGDVRVEVDPPAGPGGATIEDVEVRVVGYVPIDYPTSYYQSQAPGWHRLRPTARFASEGWPGLWPDPLLPRAALDLAADSTKAVWITVRVGEDAPAGDYAGAVRLVAEGATVAEVPFDLRVWDFALPESPSLAAIYDVRLGPGAALWEKPLGELYDEVAELMAANRLSPDVIRPGPRFRREGDRVVADFTEFDRAARRHFDDFGLPVAYTPWDFYLFGWGLPPRTILGERPYETDEPGRLRPEYRRVYQEMLRLFWDHLREQGWQERIVLYISDEPFDHHEHIREQMKALIAMIQEVDPAIPIYASTWRHVPDWDGYLNVWGIGHDGRVPVETMERLRAAGDRLWFTTDGQMCLDTPYAAVERLLPHYCFQYDVEAYEFWGITWLTYDPYRFGWHSYIHQSDEPDRSYWVRYPNGDGYLLYPGGPIGHDGPVTSIRFEQAREGVEDYEYLVLLRRLTDEGRAAGRDTAEAEAALEAAAELVSIPNPGGRYSSRILPDPAQLYEVRARLARAIEGLVELP